jgi:hypothetical protein
LFILIFSEPSYRQHSYYHWLCQCSVLPIWYRHGSICAVCSLCCTLIAGCLLELLFNLEDEFDTFLWNIGGLTLTYTALLPIWLYSCNETFYVQYGSWHDHHGYQWNFRNLQSLMSKW